MPILSKALFLALSILSVSVNTQKAVGYDSQLNRVYVGHKMKMIQRINLDSNVTAAIITCNSLQRLEYTLQSFLYYSTKSLKNLYIIEKCDQSQDTNKYMDLYPQIFRQGLKQKGQQYLNALKIVFYKSNTSQSLQKVYKLTDTRYMLVLDDTWHVTGPLGFVQRAIDVLQHDDQNIWSVQFYPTQLLDLKKQKITKNRSKYFYIDTTYSSINAFIMDKQRWNSLNWQQILKGCLSKVCMRQALLNYVNEKEAFSIALGGNYPQKVTKQTDIQYIVQQS